MIWDNYLAESEGLIFVVDSCDRARLAEAREVLHATLRKMAEAIGNSPRKADGGEVPVGASVV